MDPLRSVTSGRHAIHADFACLVGGRSLAERLHFVIDAEAFQTMKTLNVSSLDSVSGGLALNHLGTIGAGQPAPVGSPIGSPQTPINPFQLGGGIDPFGGGAPYGGGGSFDPYGYASHAAPVQQGHCGPCSPCHPDQEFSGFSANGPVAAGAAPIGGLAGGSVATPDGWGNPFGASSPVVSSSPVPANVSPGGFNFNGNPFGTF